MQKEAPGMQKAQPVPSKKPAPEQRSPGGQKPQAQQRGGPARPRRPEPMRGRAGSRRKPQPTQPQPARSEPSTKPMKKKLRIAPGITVREFAQRAGKTPSEVINTLMGLGEMITLNQSISGDALLLVADELGIDLELKARPGEQVVVTEDRPEALKPRPPVVTVMGHVDHGKTSLLDSIRNTSVTDKEMGGITQHIGASVVEFEGKTITFIDTPGHESFTALRARGAKVTDIAVLVIAADDGVMPQTIEAIDHAKAAEVPIMVAVNKIDKPDANPTRVRQQLTEFNLVPEEWGGDTIFVDVSAKEGTDVAHLLEMILLLAEVNDYRANPDAPASGNIIEARIDKGRGPIATLLIKRGTLKRTDALVAGRAFGRVRALIDAKGHMIDAAGPSVPVEILGLSTVPEAGDEFTVVEDDKKARAIAEARTNREKAEVGGQPSRSMSLEDLFRQISEGEIQEFNLIIKADTQGSVEAVRDSVEKLKVGDIEVKVIHTGVGAINENDIMLARASSAVVLGFNVRPDAGAQEVAAKEKVDVRTYRVIYQLLEDIQAALEGMLKPEYREVQIGLLDVREVFRVPRQGNIAGSFVRQGEINRNSRVRLVRDGAIIYEGKISSLRRFKDDVRSVSAGYECGVGLENFQDIKEGDMIEVIELQEVPRGAEAEV
ncbi:MAG: translation initiation factor IF-2 [Candidatus Solincola sediminis]|uniref:Translation initiation factor IF-2 n=1 Tax=Candidatus Solincola sediminis TaxID=1797199 RepID=A0A1F2WJI7_9ACTN|nr:MAG: translation initiation factor IF-2 [Candidatus Solincola sediminis]